MDEQATSEQRQGDADQTGPRYLGTTREGERLELPLIGRAEIAPSVFQLRPEDLAAFVVAFRESVQATKPGAKTSSFFITLIVGLIPPAVSLLFAFLVAQGYCSACADPALRREIIETLIYVAGLFGLGGAGVAWKYIERRGAVSVTKAEGESAALIEQLRLIQSGAACPPSAPQPKG